MAQDSEMDLVCVNTTTTPPICKIVNYEKFLYEQKKKLKNKVKTAELKEIKLGPNTSENDVEYRIKHIIEFLDKGHKVKISMQFKGRQMNHVDKGQELLLKLILEVEEHGTAESLPKLEGKKMSVTLKPKPKK
jgi:translation initiation factor IF-3